MKSYKILNEFIGANSNCVQTERCIEIRNKIAELIQKEAREMSILEVMNALKDAHLWLLARLKIVDGMSVEQDSLQSEQ